MRSWACSPSHPLLQGFVPEGLRRNILIPSFVICDGEAVNEEYNAYVLRPIRLSSEKIGKLFVEEWEKEFGENTYYLSTASTKWSCLLTRTIQREKYKLLAEMEKN